MELKKIDENMKKSIKDYYYRCNPYCFKKMGDGRYLGLNRDYLPIYRSRDDVGGRLNDSDYGILLESSNFELGITLTSIEINLLKHRGGEDMFWLYKDDCAPWNGEKYQAVYDKKKELVPKLARLA